MPGTAKTLKFIATPDKGEVSALFLRPANAEHLLVLGHGASSNMRSPMLEAIAAALTEQGIATFRYNFPYSEKGGGRNSNDVCVATVRSAVAAARQAAPDLTLVAGGHSFSGRMTSTAQSESPLDGVVGLVFFSFPLHPAGAPAVTRADHLSAIKIPMLFLSGTRDALGELALLEPVIENLGKRSTLHLVETADQVSRSSRKPARLLRMYSTSWLVWSVTGQNSSIPLRSQPHDKRHIFGAGPFCPKEEYLL